MHTSVAQLARLMPMSQMLKKTANETALTADHVAAPRWMGWVWLIAGGLAWLAALVLIAENFAQLQDKTPLINCDVSSTISCSPNFSTPAGNLLGIPNSVLGIAGFVIPMLAGALALGGARLPRWFWRAFTAGICGAMGLVLFFQYFTLTVSHVLCPNCEVVWCATVPMFFATLGWSLESGVWGEGQRMRAAGAFLRAWWWVLAIAELLAMLLASQLVFNVFGL